MLGRYELRAANELEAATGAPSDPALAALMKENRFGRSHPAAQFDAAIARHAAAALTGTRMLIPNVSFRYDHGPGAAIVFGGLDLGQGYLVPKINLVSGRGLDVQALLTGSAARFFSPYVAVGAGHQPIGETGTVTGDGAADASHWGLASELGVKFRFRLTGKARALALGYPFAGVRFGYSIFGFNNLNSRLAVEIGAGVW